MFNNTFEGVFKVFATHNVDFIIVGGYAVNFYGYRRDTGDLDLWVKPSIENMNKIMYSLKDLGFDEEELNQVFPLDLSRPVCFRLGEEPSVIDVFTHMAGVIYDDADKNKVPYKIDENLNVYFIQYYELVTNKMLSGREKDKVDVDELQKITQLIKLK